MSPALTDALGAANDADIHVALVDKVEAPRSLPTLHAMPENVSSRFDSDEELVAAVRSYTRGEMFAGAQETRTTILCCTDSRRDACCARHGFATYKALVAAADPERINVVQATHIGGCRFAASLMVLPSRQRYGRMRPDDAVPFLDAIGNGEIYLEAYRGRADAPEAAQVAELAAMRWAVDHGLPTTSPILEAKPRTANSVDQLWVEATLPGAVLSIRLRAQDFFVQGNCDIASRGEGKITPRWVLDDIEATSAS
ncbi:sucrase ferredoxin [Devosia soli]|uniref:sucrase ferredoxin n=1 Tax=Devosia soli TaxID=361041 RepID=UPI00069B7E5C|nr:sucrase ferredoxin [Devosia soli]